MYIENTVVGQSLLSLGERIWGTKPKPEKTPSLEDGLLLTETSTQWEEYQSYQLPTQAQQEQERFYLDSPSLVTLSEEVVVRHQGQTAELIEIEAVPLAAAALDEDTQATYELQKMAGTPRWIVDSIPRNSGNFGHICLVWDTKLARFMALKTISLQDPNPEEVFMLKAEAYYLAGMDHPNFVRIYDCVEFNDRPAIIMEWISSAQGEPADKLCFYRENQHIPQLKLTINTMCAITDQLSAAIAHGCQNSGPHYDLKPSNILLLWDATQKQVVVKVIDPLVAPPKLDSSTITGTPAYLSPERIISKNIPNLEGYSPINPEVSEIFSLALVLIELLTGSLLYNKSTLVDTLLAICSQPAPELLPKFEPLLAFIEQFNIDKAALLAVLSKALAHKPADRYQSVIEFAQDLIEVLKTATPKLHDVTIYPAEPLSTGISPTEDLTLEPVMPAKPQNSLDSFM